MKFLKNICSLTLIVMLLVLVGCGKTTGSTEKAAKQANGKTGIKYHRIVSLAVSSDEILLDLLPTERIAAVAASSLRSELGNTVEKAKKIPQTVDVNSPESILKVQPDLVIAPTFIRPEVITSLKDMGIRVYVYPKQNSFAEIRQSIVGIAQEVGADPQPLLQYMDSRLEALQKKLQQIPPEKRKRVVYLFTNGIYANPESPFQDICKYAGVKDAAMELGYNKKTLLSKEQMLKLNPDAIIVTDFNWDGKSATKDKIEAILQDEAYKDVKAVQNKQVFGIPGPHIYSLSHYIVHASEDVAKAVYPELFK